MNGNLDILATSCLTKKTSKANRTNILADLLVEILANMLSGLHPPLQNRICRTSDVKFKIQKFPSSINLIALVELVEQLN